MFFEFWIIRTKVASKCDEMSLFFRRRRKKRNSQDSADSLSGASQTSGTNSKKPPRKSGQKVRINESHNESHGESNA